MHVRRHARGIEVLAPAKLNLFLEVLGKRDDGFHEIETLMVPISLFDTLYFCPQASGQIELDCDRFSGSPRMATPQSNALPEGSDNLVVRAVQLLRQRAGVDQGARLRLVKRIPVAAGLAGGSSDAAAALMAANYGWALGWSRGQLAPLAAELGSDVPFFLDRAMAICRGRGERVEPLETTGPLHFVVACPPAGLATAEVYRACRGAKEPVCVEPLREALQSGRVRHAGSLLHNRLQEAAERLSPWIARLRDEFAGLDCLGHQMSGSGTSYFGICRHAKAARRIAARLANRGVDRVYAVHSSCSRSC